MHMSTTATIDPAPEIAVIIPHYNDAQRLERCLAQLMANDLSRAEVLVVDNNSPHPPDHLHARFPEVTFLSETEKGAGPARNRGVAESRAPFLAFLDSDCVPARDWLETARRIVQNADLTGGRVEVFDETPPPRNGAQAFEKVFAFNFKRYIEVQGISGAGNLITSRKVFNDVGPFRTAVSEDTDWTRRAVAKGYKLAYADDLVASHPSRSDWPALREKWRRLVQESFALALTTHPAPMARLRWALKALAMPASALVHLPKILFSPKLDDTGERLRGAITLVRLRFTRMIWMLRQALGAAI